MHDFFRDVWSEILSGNLAGLTGAVLILFAGWILALWLSVRLSSVFYRAVNGIKERSDAEKYRSAVKRIIFWLVMIFPILGSMSVLDLDEAALPLREFMSEIANYLPKAAGALILLFAAGVISNVVRRITERFMMRESIKSGIKKRFHAGAEKAAERSAAAAGMLVYLFFLPAILNALGIYGITEPLGEMFRKILLYLPGAAAGILIFWIGIWAANRVKSGVSGAVVLIKPDIFAFEAPASENRLKFFASAAGNVCWVLIIIPVSIAALNALNIDFLSRSISGFLDILLKAAGNIVGAAVVLTAAYFAGRAADASVRRILLAFNCDMWLKNLGIGSEKIREMRLSAIAGKVSMLAVIVMGLLGASELLHLDFVALLIRRFAIFGGNIILSSIVLLAGCIAAEFVSGIIISEKIKWLSPLVKVLLIFFALALSLSNLGVGQRIVELTFGMIIGAFCTACAIAFGVGGREFASKVLASLSRNLEK